MLGPSCFNTAEKQQGTPNIEFTSEEIAYIQLSPGEELKGGRIIVASRQEALYVFQGRIVGDAFHYHLRIEEMTNMFIF
jgi:hypothetical protein